MLYFTFVKKSRYYRQSFVVDYLPLESKTTGVTPIDNFLKLWFLCKTTLVLMQSLLVPIKGFLTNHASNHAGNHVGNAVNVHEKQDLKYLNYLK